MYNTTLTAVVAAGAAGVWMHPAGRPLLKQYFYQANSAAAEYPPWKIALGAVGGFIVVSSTYDFLFCHEGTYFERLKTFVFSTARKIPFVENMIQAQLKDIIVGLEKDLIKNTDLRAPVHRIPDEGKSADELELLLVQTSQAGDPEKRRKDGKMSGTIYVGGENYEEYSSLLTKAYGLFAWTNPLHATVFPGVRQMEAEVISMCVGIFGGGKDACGSHTSGGTESIIMAVKAYRDYARQTRGITKPNLVTPRTAHPAFDKACQYLGIAIRKIQEDPVTRKADVKAMARAMDSNTIALVGSCPQYPHGTVDPIVELGKLAHSRGVGLHVDCCLGSFVVPFMRDAGFDFPDFNFTVTGVTSISADTHKFGYAPKGSSVVLYKTKALRRAQYACFPDWPGGVYGTPCMAGSRPGALIAGTWTALMYHGKKGYVESTRGIITACYSMAEGLKKIEGIDLLCEPQGPIVSWHSKIFDINRLCEGLIKQCGYDINVLQFPASMHICCTRMHTQKGFVEKFLADVERCTKPLLENPSIKVEGAGAVYGTAQAIPDRSIIADVVGSFIDVTYQVEAELQPITNGKDKH